MAMIRSEIIKIRDVNFSFDHRRKMIDNINVDISGGALTVILGKNGSGKSTLLRLLTGMNKISSGSIKIEGKELSEIRLSDKARLFSFLPQSHKPVFPYKVHDVVLTGRSPHSGFLPGKNDHFKVEETLEKLEIPYLKNRIYSQLSGGERQLVMIARIIVQETRIIFMDEPVSHLDFNNQIRIIKLLKNMVSEGYSIIISLHDPNFAFLAGDEFLLINDGKIMKTDRQRPWENNEINQIFGQDILKINYKDKKLFIPDL
jgi:iron complex transport system ATP-binding protein